MQNENTQVQTCDCAAHGCPMYGTSSRSTTGGTDWYCFIHFGAEAKDWPHINAELNRLGWLVKIVRELRQLAYVKGFPSKFTADARQAITLSQRGDLQMRIDEATVDWMIRLEGILAQSCKDSLVQP